MKKEFEINTELYSDDVVKQAISDFIEAGEIKYNSGKIEIFGDDEKEIEEVFNELMNYIVGLINE